MTENDKQFRTPHSREERLAAVGRLMDIVEELRQRCPWDREQTFESLRPNTIEEVYELCDATLRHDWKNVCKELGDTMEHVLFYALMGSEQGLFDLADVCHSAADKLVYRHPHVYGTTKVDGTDDVLNNWEQLKLKEKDGNKSALAGVPSSLPTLIKAFRIGEKAAHVGFDWEQKEDVWQKVREELSELEAVLHGDDTKKTEELGDILFAIVNAARLYGINPDTALARSNEKFIRRFNHIEAAAKAQGHALSSLTPAAMDALWHEAKQAET